MKKTARTQETLRASRRTHDRQPPLLPLGRSTRGGRTASAAMRGGWLVNLAVARSDRSVRKRACRLVGPDEHARLSGVADELLDRRVGVGRREEPPRYESGFRAHGSNQQFHRLLRHAVARALTTAPSLAGVSPAAADILIRHRWRRKGRPGRCCANRRRCRNSNAIPSCSGGVGRH